VKRTVERPRAIRISAVIASGLMLAACNSAPNWAELRTPQLDAYVPTDANQYRAPASGTSRPVTARDLVDAQGLCAGAAGTEASAGQGGAASRLSGKGVGLGMTECEVVATIGQAQSVNADGAAGERVVTMTYSSGERPGVYRFVAGRLVTMERGAEAYASAPPPQKKPPAKKPAPSR
jgi:hypothetical protein